MTVSVSVGADTPTIEIKAPLKLTVSVSSRGSGREITEALTCLVSVTAFDGASGRRFQSAGLRWSLGIVGWARSMTTFPRLVTGVAPRLLAFRSIAMGDGSKHDLVDVVDILPPIATVHRSTPVCRPDEPR